MDGVRKKNRFKSIAWDINIPNTSCFKDIIIILSFFSRSGHGIERNYELAATQYKYASDQSQNSQAMFNLAYMHEKGLGLKRVSRFIILNDHDLIVFFF